MTGPEEEKAMSCEEFHALMPELVGSGEDILQHPHMRSCERCRAFLAELQTIADAARELFPAVEPRDELWANIDAAIRSEYPSG